MKCPQGEVLSSRALDICMKTTFSRDVNLSEA